MSGIKHDMQFGAFRFLVELGDGGGSIAAAFAQFSGIKMRTATVQVRGGSEKRGVADIIPATTSFEPVTFTKGVIGDLEFLDWILSVAPGHENPPTGDKCYRNITVAALDERGNRGIEWTLINALPTAYELSAMDASQSSVLTETIEFSIMGFQRTTKAPVARTMTTRKWRK